MSRISKNFSRIGNGATVACMVHCLLFPVLISVLPILGLGFLLRGWFEFTMLFCGVGFSLLSLCWGYRVHKSIRGFALLLAAVAWLLLARNNYHHQLYSLVGAGCLISANIINQKACRACSKCHH